MKRCSFNVAQAIKEAGYQQLNTKQRYTTNGALIYCMNLDDVHNTQYDAPTYLDVWLWIWREKGIHIDIDYCINQCSIFDITNQVIYTRTFADPEEAIIAAIEHIIDNDLIK